MRLLRAMLSNGYTHWFNPALYEGLEFSKGEDGHGKVVCYYRGSSGSHTTLDVENVELLAADYDRLLRGDDPGLRHGSLPPA